MALVRGMGFVIAASGERRARVAARALELRDAEARTFQRRSRLRARPELCRGTLYGRRGARLCFLRFGRVVARHRLAKGLYKGLEASGRHRDDAVLGWRVAQLLEFLLQVSHVALVLVEDGEEDGEQDEDREEDVQNLSSKQRVLRGQSLARVRWSRV